MVDGSEHDDLREWEHLNHQKKLFGRKNALRDAELRPSQKLCMDSINDPQYSLSIFTGPNQVGKTHFLCLDVHAEFQGFQPWDGVARRFDPPVKIAALLNDFDNHAKIVYDKMCELVPEGDLKVVEQTQQRAPRVIRHLPTGSELHIFTHAQDPKKLEGGTWHKLVVDEPCPRGHFIALRRGVQKVRGHILFTMTPLSEPWIFDEFYDQAGNLGGEKKHVFAVTAFPDENKVSAGGHVDDEAMEEFWGDCSREELEARKFGRWIHLIGRVHKNFDERVHVIEEDPVDPKLCPHGIVIDPHDRKPFAIAWYYITPGDDVVFCNEWPEGDFHKMRDSDIDVPGYAKLIQAYGPVHLGQMDPNYGRRRSSISDETIEDALVKSCWDLGYELPISTEIDDDHTLGHKVVQNKLSYDTKQPITPLNSPKLFFKSNCVNLIRAMRNYTWDDWKGRTAEGRSVKQKPKEEFKDFADLVRYACVADPVYFEPTEGYEFNDEPIYNIERGWDLTSSDKDWIHKELLRKSGLA